MPSTLQTDRTPVARRPRGEQDPRARWFCALVFLAILTALAIGFAPTFFLRPLFDAPPLPGYLYVHGVILTLWFMLVFTQSVLVAKRHLQRHRMLGYAGFAVAAAVIVSGGHATVYSIARLKALNVDRVFVENVTVANLLALLVFAALIALGLVSRRRPDVHRRLMLLSALTIVGPILARFTLSYGLDLPRRLDLFLLACIALSYDVIALGRLHRTTLASVAVVLLVLVAGHAALVATGVAAALVDCWR